MSMIRRTNWMRRGVITKSCAVPLIDRRLSRPAVLCLYVLSDFKIICEKLTARRIFFGFNKTTTARLKAVHVCAIMQIKNRNQTDKTGKKGHKIVLFHWIFFTCGMRLIRFTIVEKFAVRSRLYIFRGCDDVWLLRSLSVDEVAVWLPWYRVSQILLRRERTKEREMCACQAVAIKTTNERTSDIIVQSVPLGLTGRYVIMTCGVANCLQPRRLPYVS